jgi:hypothetical protein
MSELSFVFVFVALSLRLHLPLDQRQNQPKQFDREGERSFKTLAIRLASSTLTTRFDPGTNTNPIKSTLASAHPIVSSTVLIPQIFINGGGGGAPATVRDESSQTW